MNGHQKAGYLRTTFHNVQVEQPVVVVKSHAKLECKDKELLSNPCFGSTDIQLRIRAQGLVYSPEVHFQNIRKGLQKSCQYVPELTLPLSPENGRVKVSVCSFPRSNQKKQALS
jgi:hypothetical protein